MLTHKAAVKFLSCRIQIVGKQLLKFIRECRKIVLRLILLQTTRFRLFFHHSTSFSGFLGGFGQSQQTGRTVRKAEN
jgi:hypothetical protein